jgi:glutamine amidotransferase
MPKLGVLNYGSGNFTSVSNALEYLGLEWLEITEPRKMEQASHLVLPGVGSFPAAMDKLEQMGLADGLHEQVLHKEKPFLGICIGMQILADVGYEFCERRGLGFISGKVQLLDAASHGLRTPHMGWNELTSRRGCPLLAEMPEPCSFYFVHSYHLQPSDPAVTVAYCDYGTEITACVQRDNVFGVQFHPEKSQRDGLQLLKNFSNI